MDKRRVSERNKITNDIKMLQNYIAVDKRTIDRLEQNDYDEHTTKQLIKLNTTNKERLEEIKRLNNRHKNVTSGLLDKELEQVGKVVTKKHNEDNLPKITKIKKDYNAYRQYSKDYSRADKKEIDRSYKYFERIEPPEYIARNLKAMPNNKGYIFRDVYFFGELPSEKGKPVVMTEKKRGDISMTHEWNSKEYKIYERQGKGGRKTLIQSNCRRNIEQSGNGLGGYLKF